MKTPPLKALLWPLLLFASTSLAGPAASPWSNLSSPELPYRYIKTPPDLRISPQTANAETYVPEALFSRLYPSISTVDLTGDALETNIQASIASKKEVFYQLPTRGNLSTYYVQEFAYITTYSNIRKYEDFIAFPSIRMSLALPRFGNGFGGGYQPLQFGFSPAAFRFW